MTTTTRNTAPRTISFQAQNNSEEFTFVHLSCVTPTILEMMLPDLLHIRGLKFL